MKRISLFSALLILLMFLASCNAVSRTDPEKGNTDNAVSLEEGGFDIGEKDVSTNMNKRIIDFTINDIILLEELKTAEGTIAAEYVFPETEHLDAPETRILSISSEARTLRYLDYEVYSDYYDGSPIDEYIDPLTDKVYLFTNKTGKYVGYNTVRMSPSSTVVKYRTYDDFLGAALSAASEFADLSKWDYDVEVERSGPYDCTELRREYCFTFVRQFSGILTTERVVCIVRGDGDISCFTNNIGMFDDVQPIDFDLFKLQLLAQEKLKPLFDYINSNPVFNVINIGFRDDMSTLYINEKGELEFHFGIEFNTEYFKDPGEEPILLYDIKRMYIVLD